MTATVFFLILIIQAQRFRCFSVLLQNHSVIVVDRVQIEVKAGRGGNGCVSFHSMSLNRI